MITLKSPAIKGVITAAIMAAYAYFLYTKNERGDSSLQYVSFIIYGAGILWTLFDYKKSPSYTGRFKDNFGQGFRCFIVVTFIMVAFTGIFSAAHPEFAREAAESIRKDSTMIKDRTPPQIDEMVEKAKKQYTVTLVSISIFGYLIVGAAITAAGSALLIKRQQ